jgi:methyl coenzyme M reductase alpha subunit
MSILSSILTYDSIKSIELVDIIFDYKDKFSIPEFQTMRLTPSNITELIIKNSTITYEQIFELIYLCSKLQTVTISGCKYFDDVSNDFVNFNDFNNESFKDNYVFMRMKNLKEMKKDITITIL